MQQYILLGFFATAIVASVASGGEVGFAEDFALAKDRTNALKQLIPGTEDYYYYHALHFLNTEQFDKAEAQLKPWVERFGQTARVTEIQTRHALLIYDANTARTLKYLREHLSLHFNHQKEDAGGAPNLPTAIDPQRITRAALLAESLGMTSLLENFENSALDWLAAENLTWERRRNLLQRLERPDLANLPKLIVDDLTAEHPPEFGAYAIHRQLTLSQLEELLKLRPALLNQSNFVQTWLTKLQPGADEDWLHDPTRLRAYLDRLLTFVRRLSPAHNALKAHVLFHRLTHDRTQGAYDKALFIEYLKLPRRQPYMSKTMLESTESARFPADLGANYNPLTMLAPIGGDEPLVRDTLKHFLADADSPREFAGYINDVYLTHLFAETKIELGLGEPERWASQLPPEQFRLLKERIDIDFAPINKTAFTADEPVRLDLFVKNVPTLIVKVFEINTVNFYRENKREIDTDINLDGLVANIEETKTYTEPPLRRMPRRFDFPQIAKPGVYVIDFIGAGQSSRVLVRKGRLRPIVTGSTAGQSITVVDELNNPVKDAAVWLGGQEYAADKDGKILVPFSTAPGRQPIVLRRGDFASLDHLDHQAETYRLDAGIHVDREALLTQRVASVLVRPGLKLNGRPVSIKLLESVNLRIVATDHDGIATSTDVPEFKLFEDRESIHELRVPPRLASLTVTLTGMVKSISTNAVATYAASTTVALNGIAKTEKIEDLHLAKFGADYVIELLGRTGEAKPDRTVHVSLKHRDFKATVKYVVKTDAQGRVKLGPLPDITSVGAVGPEGTEEGWRLPTDKHTYRQVMHAKTGDVIALPYMVRTDKPDRAELALFEVRGSTIRADQFGALTIRDSAIEMKGLAAGDYDLWLKTTGERIRIRVVDGGVVAGHVLGTVRQLQLAGLKPVQIAAITADADTVTIRLRDASVFTRVHVFATRYRPAFSAFDDLAKVRDVELAGAIPARAESAYISGRNIGDEYRYVLDRKYQRKHAGNMLDRPALLLNPWAVRATDSGEQEAKSGAEFGSRGGTAAGRAMQAPGAKPAAGAIAPGGDFAELDYLANASAVMVNLLPDKDGVLKIARKDFGPHSMIHVVAIDPLHATSRSATLAEAPTNFLDLRLKTGLDPKGHFTQAKQISILTKGEPFVLADAAAGRFEAYDSLAKVYGLYSTLGNDPKLAEFAFILKWPTLKPEEKRAQYSKYACHELSFFLSKKDPEFFKTVILPYLANKKDKTFLDHWLLGSDLKTYLEPWNHVRLNTVERVLLAQRLAGEPAKTARYLNDLWRLLPPQTDRLRVLYETAVKAGEMSKGDMFGLSLRREAGVTMLESRMNVPQSRQEAMDAMTPATSAGAPAAAPAPPGGPGGGGGGPLGGMKAATLEKKARDGRTMDRAAADKKDSPEQLREELSKEKAEFYEEDRAKKQVAQLYRKLDPTMEWAENNYYHLRIQQQLAGLVGVGPFWLDYAKHDPAVPFLSKHLADASHNFTEMMFALAVLDLPFAAGKHEVKFDGNKMTFTPAGPVIAFHEEVRPTGAPAGPVQILVSQNFYRQGDRYREENGERIDKFVTDEFVVHTVYGCQLVVTNPTPSRQRLSVLVQVPVGAVPVGNGQFTKSVALDLEPYRTQTIDYTFYFPKAGSFAHFPVHVAKAEAPVAAAGPFTFNVVEKPTKLDTQSWDYVSQNGTRDQVLAFLTRENIGTLNLDKIAFRMGDKEFFTAVIALLQERHVYHSTLWSYAIQHNLAGPAREFLKHHDQLVAECAGPIDSPLLVLDPVLRHQYEHLEYKPLVNARAHSLGARRQIVNARVHEQYHAYLKLLSYRRSLTHDDNLAVVYDLLLQDRVEEAATFFAAVDRGQVATQMQYDYCAAYLEMSGDAPQKARPIAAKYADYPVDRWKNAFATITQQLDEIEGKNVKAVDADDRAQKQAQLAAQTPGFEFTLDAATMNLTWQNLATVRVNYYLMDVELLFSRNPFVAQSGGQFASIRPNATKEVTLPAGQAKLAVPLPAELVKRNLLVEVTANGKTRTLPYYANAMNLQLTENYGQLRVADATNGKALAKVYVKTYVRLADGKVKFHKDGYTDHRGRFDYASVSTPESSGPARFAILVLSEDHGALIREAAPPQR